jgi:oligopeptide/dipeptide ABC transporter ATP-binding protein
MGAKERDKLLYARNLHVEFRTGRGTVKAVNGVSFSVGKGETLGVVGESGCGKSVSALAVMGLIDPPGRVTLGEIFFDGKDLLLSSEAEMRALRGNRISMIFQEPMTSLNPVHRAGEQIAETIRLHRRFPRRKARDLAVEMLSKVGIPDPEKRYREYPHQMSGGMCQRVMIAMALSCDPDLLIADEPTTALDVTIQAQILDLVNGLRERGTSVLLITHDLGVIAEMAHNVVVMYAGSIVESAPAPDLFSAPAHPYTTGLLESVPPVDGPLPSDRMLKAIPGTVPSLLDLPPGCPFRERCVRAFGPCSEGEPPLFEVDVGHFTRCWQYGRA